MNIFKVISILLLASLVKPSYGSDHPKIFNLNTFEYHEYGITESCICNIRAKKISGPGLISADFITIKCADFDFTGTINCNKKCTIYCKNPFDANMFTKRGTGSFSIMIVNNDLTNFEDRNIPENATLFRIIEESDAPRKMIIAEDTEESNQTSPQSRNLETNTAFEALLGRALRKSIESKQAKK